MTKPIVLPSPNEKNKAILTYAGEIQADKACFTLSIEGLSHSFDNRIFGEASLWSPESRFLALQEWKDIDEDDSPGFCQLLIIDLLTRRECVIANVEVTKGNILPESFIGDSLMYTVIYYGEFGMTKSFETRFRYLDGWQILK